MANTYTQLHIQFVFDRFWMNTGSCLKNLSYRLTNNISLSRQRKIKHSDHWGFLSVKIASREDRMMMSWNTISTITNLSLRKEYSEATTDLQRLNKEFPELGTYDYFNLPNSIESKKNTRLSRKL